MNSSPLVRKSLKVGSMDPSWTLMIGDSVFYLHQLFHWIGACWHTEPVRIVDTYRHGKVEVFGKHCCVCGKIGNRTPNPRWWEETTSASTSYK